MKVRQTGVERLYDTCRFQGTNACNEGASGRIEPSTGPKNYLTCGRRVVVGGSDERTEMGETGETETREANDETNVPTEVARLERGQVLCDRHRKECFVVREVTKRGTHLEQESENFFVPHSLLAPWVDSRLFEIDESESADLPDWLSERRR